MTDRRVLLITALIFAGLAGLWLPASGQETKGASAEQRAAHLEKMRELARSIKVAEVLNEDKRSESKLVDQPALAYRDDTRKLFDSTMWVWGTDGRPSAMIAIEFYPQRPMEPRWLYEIVSLSANRIAAERGEELAWTAREPGLKLTVLEGSPEPGEKATTRLAQMRQLRRRFAAHEKAPVGGRIELQPLAAPLFRYQNAKQGILDGAVFAFANGTNPEVLWIIEATQALNEKPKWQFSLAQMTGAEVFVSLDEKQIWQCSEADPPAERGSYVNGWLTSTDDQPAP